MSEELGRDRGANSLPLYIDGYFTQRVRNGDVPDYGYPKNHVPDVTVDRMEVTTGFMAALKRKK